MILGNYSFNVICTAESCCEHITVGVNMGHSISNDQKVPW